MKQKIISVSFVIFIIGFFIMSFVYEDKEVSTFERRKLAQMPKIDDKFTQNLDTYIMDQFPFREQFINLNSNINRRIWNIKDYNNVYISNDIIYEIYYSLDEKLCSKFSDKMNYIINKDLKNSNVYYSIIPDKEYFLSDEKFLKIDYQLLKEKANINAKYIDLTEQLNIYDYYRTDIHWKQENLQRVAKTIVEQMGNVYKDMEYTYHKYEPFYGSSYSKAGINIKPDELIYLNNKYIEQAVVNHLEYGEKNVYDLEKLGGVNSYDIYLSGGSSIIEITNPLSDNNKELIVFRDSFMSSLTPLLIPYYSKITLIDLRYINYRIVSSIIDFSDKDILFIYSTQVINNSNLLKVML